MLLPAVLLAVILLHGSGCKKEVFGNGHISFNTDTLTFDTVFSSVGSTTKYFKVFNTSSKGVRIEDIRLAHLVGNQFRINVDGISGDQFAGVEIPAKDSIYVFVEVTVNPNNQTTPFVIIDDVTFTTGGEMQTVHLQAFGQNAHFHYGETIKANTTWNSDLPHVIIANDTSPGVFVECGATLTILPGAKVYFAGNSALFIAGRLEADHGNSWNDSIVFEGARLEEYYYNKPGQWFGIVFFRTGNCTPFGSLKYCLVNESNYGIYAGAGYSGDINDYLGATGRPDVTIKNTIVKNSQSNAVYGFNAQITAENCLFHTAGEHLVKLGLGGSYNFNYCTLYNVGSRYVDHQKESLLLSNLVRVGNSLFASPLNSSFSNCVVYGSMENEVAFSKYANETFSTSFEYTLAKAKTDSFAIFASPITNLFNQDPRFREPASDNFTPSDSSGYFSPAIDFAPEGPSIDLFNHPRPASKTVNLNKYDIGAVEAQ